MRMPIAAISSRMTEPNSCDYPAASETGHVDHHEGKNDERLADKDPVKQSSSFHFASARDVAFGHKCL